MGRGDRCSVKTKKCSKNDNAPKQTSLQKRIAKNLEKMQLQSTRNTCTININSLSNRRSDMISVNVKAKSQSQKKIPSKQMIMVEEERIDMVVKNPSLILIEDETSHSTNYDSYGSPRMNGSSINDSVDCYNMNQHNNPQPSIFQSAKTNVPFQIKTRSSRQIMESQTYIPQQNIHELIEDPQALNPLENPKMRSPADYACFVEVPCVYPTEEEFSDPYTLFSMLHQQGYSKHGIIKIIPPKSWKPEYSFDKIKDKVTTRSQILADLSSAQPFSQNTDSCTYKEFQQMAQDFKRTYQFQTKTNLQNEHRKIEYEFWEHVEHPELFKDELEVEYAADLPSKKYGSAFSLMNNMTNSAFNLNNINSSKNSLFQHFQKDNNGISGISNPWIYLGMMFASFCWHVEDLYMCALNYLHIGEAKTWYGIPPEYKYKFEDVYKKTYPQIFQKKPDVLFHINLMLSPAVAAENGIPVYRTEQKPGEFIFTFPKTYHAGFSHGFNCGEAVNVITFDWFQNYKEAVQYYQSIKHPTKNFLKSASFAVEWLISQVVYNLDTTSFDKPTMLKIKNEWEKIVEAEEDKRKRVVSKYGEQNLKINEFANKTERYDRHVCCYLFCNTCIKKSCLNHDNPCKCKKVPQLFVRHTTEDFEEQEELIEEKIKSTNCH